MSSELLRFDLLIRGGTVVDPAAGRHGAFDVGIVDGRIAAVEPALDGARAQTTLDATGMLVLPGMIDTHAHLVPLGRSLLQLDGRGKSKRRSFSPHVILGFAPLRYAPGRTGRCGSSTCIGW